MHFSPDYHNLLDAAQNREAARLPLYEHGISVSVMEEILGKKFSYLQDGTDEDLVEFFRIYCDFYRRMGYDTVTYEACLDETLYGGGALGGHKKGIIQTREDFEKYPWERIEPEYFSKFERPLQALTKAMPEGMKAVGGVGNGVFEVVQDLVGYMDLCYLSYDDPQLYADLFVKVGDTLLRIWKRFLHEFGEVYCVCRFGDDLGFKSTTLLPAEDIRSHIIPQYQKIIAAVHESGKPFLLHSCGQIFDVMDDLIDVAKIDAKHSNEDQIAMFDVWVDRYGDRIGNFGGIDTDVLCRFDDDYIRNYVLDMIPKCVGKGGFAFSSGNTIPDYVPAHGYLAMVRAVREYRGDLEDMEY